MSESVTPEIIRSQRKTLSLQFLRDGKLVVKAPLHLPQHLIHAFITEHTEWIEKHSEKMKSRKKSPHLYTQGEEFWYLGSKVSLDIGMYKEIKVVGDTLQFPQHLAFRIKKELEFWYSTHAKKLITHQTEKYAQEIKTSYQEITFSDTKSQWGRCTHDNRLQFSWRLIMAPPLTLNYVVIHELVHTIEKNHSRSFWSKVRQFNPSYRQQIKWLQLYGNELFL